MECSEAGNTIEELKVIKGYWRPSKDSVDVIKCVSPTCQGGSNASTEAACKEGNEGVMCAVCSEGWVRHGQANSCFKCVGEVSVWLLAILGMLGVAFFLTVVLMMNRRVPSALMRPMINLVQTLSVMLLFDAPFPAAFIEL